MWHSWAAGPGYRITRLWRFDSSAAGNQILLNLLPPRVAYRRYCSKPSPDIVLDVIVHRNFHAKREASNG